MVRNQGRVTRFVVMAMLQAARARALGLDQEAAYSWGLNRAIFYAAAKAGFRGGSGGASDGSMKPKSRPVREVFHLGDDEAFRDPTSDRLTFSIGEKDQTVQEFEKAVSSRFGNQANFRAAWDEAMSLMAQFDRSTLESRERFYGEVYKPRRDGLSDKWTQEYSPPPAKSRKPAK